MTASSAGALARARRLAALRRQLLVAAEDRTA